MLREIEQLQEELGLSNGELLSMAREIAANDVLRTIDRLTSSERAELILALETLRLRNCAVV